MSFNMLTDKEFDRALADLVKQTGKTKSQIVRDLVIAAREQRGSVLPFGLLAHQVKKHAGVENIVASLKELDDDLA
jgi:hypothetical protein